MGLYGAVSLGPSAWALPVWAPPGAPLGDRSPSMYARRNLIYLGASMNASIQPSRLAAEIRQ